jgi:hypothetical protein
VGYPTLALLVRRPDNTWDDLYPVTSSKEGNRPFVILNEAAGKIKVFYTAHLINFDGTRTGDILYRESTTAAIAFGPPITLLSGNGINSLIYTTSTHQTYNPEILVLTTNESASPYTAVGILATDETLPGMLTTSPASPTLSVKAIYQEMTEHNGKGRWLARPNPFTSNIMLDFSLPQSGRYSATLFDNQGKEIRVLSRGWADAGIRNLVSIDASGLANGIYYVRIQAGRQIQTLKMLKR